MRKNKNSKNVWLKCLFKILEKKNILRCFKGIIFNKCNLKKKKYL